MQPNCRISSWKHMQSNQRLQAIRLEFKIFSSKPVNTLNSNWIQKYLDTVYYPKTQEIQSTIKHKQFQHSIMCTYHKQENGHQNSRIKTKICLLSETLFSYELGHMKLKMYISLNYLTQTTVSKITSISKLIKSPKLIPDIPNLYYCVILSKLYILYSAYIHVISTHMHVWVFIECFLGTLLI